MSRSNIEKLPTSQFDIQQRGNLTTRDFLQVAASVGFAAAALGVPVPTEEEVEAVYTLLATHHAKRLEGYVPPVSSFPRGDWSLVSTSEVPISLKVEKQRENGISTDEILEEQEIIKYVKGDYIFINEDKLTRLLLHLGLHGQHGRGLIKHDSRAPITLEQPAQLGAISLDSIHSISAWQKMGIHDRSRNHTTIDLRDVRPEIISDIEYSLTAHMGDWVRNLNDTTIVLATDIPMNEAVGWEVFLELLANPSVDGVIDDLGPLKQSAEFISAAMAASCAGEMIKNLFKSRMTRGDFLKLPGGWRKSE